MFPDDAFWNCIMNFLSPVERSNCFSTPCLNGGTCIEEPGGYKCNCKYHYSGINCQGWYLITKFLKRSLLPLKQG